MRELRPDILKVAGCARDRSTHFIFNGFEACSWPDGCIIVKGDLEVSHAREIAIVLAGVLKWDASGPGSNTDKVDDDRTPDPF